MNETTKPGEPHPPLPADGTGHACRGDARPSDPAGVAAERNRFFTGKYMAARDFRDEQEYFLSRHRLHQRALHGWGIVCGLEVRPHKSPECQAQGYVVVTPGIAIDCYGREMVLHEATPVRLDRLFPDEAPVGEEARNPGRKDLAAELDREHLLGIRYGEVFVEEVPLLYDEEGCGQRTAMNRVREQPFFRRRPYVKGDACWQPPGLRWLIPRPAQDCLQPACPCGRSGFVPLCWFKLTKAGDGVTVKTRSNGRRFVPGPLHPWTLTHIIGVNWSHGSRQGINALIEASGGAVSTRPRTMRLTMRFDRPLCDRTMPATDPEGAFYDRIVRVRFGKAGRVPETVAVTLSADRTELHCDVEAPSGGEMVQVSVNCDFLIDCQGRAVDGNHLRGALPTGNGAEGGLFESWFWVADQPTGAL